MKAILSIITVASIGLSAHALTYPGNGNTGFGGAIGSGSLTLTDNGTTLSGSLTKGAGGFNDVLVLYIDVAGGGFGSTSGFTDSADGLRQAISGFDGSNRSTLNFASGFSPEYAIALGPSSDNFGGLWSLANGGSLGFVSSVNLTPTGSATSPTYTFSLALSSIGLTPNAGQSFEIFGTYISHTGFRSGEAIAGNDSGTQGWGNTMTQTSFGTYITTVPEPSTMVLGAAGLATLLLLKRRR